MILAHALVGAEGDDHRDLLRATGQPVAEGAHDQRQRTGPGAVGHDQADPFGVEVGAGQSAARRTR